MIMVNLSDSAQKFFLDVSWCPDQKKVDVRPPSIVCAVFGSRKFSKNLKFGSGVCSQPRRVLETFQPDRTKFGGGRGQNVLFEKWIFEILGDLGE